MKKITLALLLIANAALAGQYDGAYLCSYEGKQFYQMVDTKADDSALVVVACPGPPEYCTVGGYALGAFSGATFSGRDALLSPVSWQFTATGFDYSDTLYSASGNRQIAVSCSRVW